MSKGEDISQISDEFFQRRETQLAGLRRAWRVAIEEYLKNMKGHWPELNTEEKVNLFLSVRPDLKKAVFGLDMVLKEVSQTAWDVLREMKQEAVEKKAT